ncbi:hypothetical protein PTTG_28346 [Puccinia triticina 1-1 BBBD Race 1]|uniref:Golgi apparatus membrane protein TVP38 n=1 Tax=Puccinia triticina (isolate 1-1 / race 1 (BBBD)) TaxID=630390 RepID=A0A180GCJ2_PUCT1|nr:hypothetical protein PTTG_28346 [Puccinia triticina 1-1 BBBD Race 1]
MGSKHPFYWPNSGYPERIQRLEHLVQILLARTKPAQPLYLSASVPQLVFCAPPTGSFQYSIKRGLEPLVSDATAHSLQLSVYYLLACLSTSPSASPAVFSISPRSSSKTRRPPRASTSSSARSSSPSTLASLLILAAAIHSVPLLRLPTSLELITRQISHLRTYSHFSVPGTALLNILIGAIFPIWIAAPLSFLLTATYLLVHTARPLFVRLIPRPLILIQRAIDPFRLKGSPKLASYLLIAGPLPIFPYAALNLASGVLKHPLLSFFWTILIGSLPYNLLTTQPGDILRSAAKSTSPEDHFPPCTLHYPQISLPSLMTNQRQTIAMSGVSPTHFT